MLVSPHSRESENRESYASNSEICRGRKECVVMRRVHGGGFSAFRGHIRVPNPNSATKLNGRHQTDVNNERKVDVVRERRQSHARVFVYTTLTLVVKPLVHST
jgi:hypothetical protein